VAALSRLGSRVVKIPWDEWVQVFVTHRYEGMDGLFIHPVSDRGVIAGNGTIGLEILEDLPDVEAVIVPFGGGGLSSGIAAAIRALKPETKVYGSEVETATPLAAAFAAGTPTTVVRTPSFVDGIGAPVVLEEMWPLVRAVLDGALVVSLAETTAAIRLLAERVRVIAEGAGASSVAAALSGKAGHGKVVCVVSGGNIDVATLVRILQGEVP
jgi:threonine dehydratase